LFEPDYTTNEPCPFCKAPADWRKQIARADDVTRLPAWQPWLKTRYSAMGMGMAQAIDAGAEYERRRPARNASMESDVLVPFLQSTFTGLLAGIVGSGVALLVFPTSPAWISGPSVGAIAWGIAWMVLLKDHRALLWEIERVIKTDIDQDGQIGQPGEADAAADQDTAPRRNDVTRVELTEQTRTSQRIVNMELPIDPNKFRILARGVLNGFPLSEAQWAGKGNLLSTPKFRQFQDALLERSFATWKDPEAHRLGIQLTRGGISLFRSISSDPTPLPQAEE